MAEKANARIQLFYPFPVDRPLLNEQHFRMWKLGYGTDRCAHGCHEKRQVADEKILHHCVACDGSRAVMMSHSSVPVPVADEIHFRNWWVGEKDLWDYCVCALFPTNCRFHSGKPATDGPHNLLPGRSNSVVGKMLENVGLRPMSGSIQVNFARIHAPELRKRYEDEVVKRYENMPDWKKAVEYSYLHSLGFRIDSTENIIRDGLKKEAEKQQT